MKLKNVTIKIIKNKFIFFLSKILCCDEILKMLIFYKIISVDN